MKVRPHPLAIAISSALLMNQLAYANGAANGADGASNDGLLNVTYELIGIPQQGIPGDSIDPNGGNSGNVPGRNYTLGNAGSLTTINGAAGIDGGSVSSSGAGAGGHGGASVMGGLSRGGAAGAVSGSSNTANGGNGGNVLDSVLHIVNTRLDGNIAAGGNGGNVLSYLDPVFSSYMYLGGAGAAGHGGGSLFGGISQGGAGGYSAATPGNTDQINGGNGGNVTGHTLHLTDSTLKGGAGGNGGNFSGVASYSATTGGAGAAGHGGGSIVAGISQGGAGGGFDSGPRVSTNIYANGGHGGEVSDNRVTVDNSVLEGAQGGNGGDFTINIGYSNGATGAGGHGGASVFGGVSQGGSAGTASTTTTYNPAAAPSANGGNGGEVNRHHITVSNAQLKGAKAGHGGSFNGGNIDPNIGETSMGGTGAGGHGGGSIVAGLSQGGAGGHTTDNSTTVTEDIAGIARGGNGGGVSGHRITASDSILTGQAGGNGGHFLFIGLKNGATGAGGHGGGSVLGGISQGGAAGVIWFADNNAARGGSGGQVNNNTLELIRMILDGTDANGGNAGSTTNTTNNIAADTTAGGTGAAGNGGGSAYGGISQGGAGGFSGAQDRDLGSASGGHGNEVSDHIISVTDSTLKGGQGGASGSHSPPDGIISARVIGGSGIGGNGGGSIFGGQSQGGAAGHSGATNGSAADGGDGGKLNRHTLTLSQSILIGAAGGNSGSLSSLTDAAWGSSGSAGHGGGSVVGGLSQGGAAGWSGSVLATAQGGNGGEISNHLITVSDSTLTGAAGGNSGSLTSSNDEARGSTGAAGHGGGSVVGGISQGGGGGETDIALNSTSSSNGSSSTAGGAGGTVSSNTLVISRSLLDGSNAQGGNAGHLSSVTLSQGGAGSGGHGGGSIIGGLSQGGAGGYTHISIPVAITSPAIGDSNGGHGAEASSNTITVTDTTLKGAAGGAGGRLISTGVSGGGTGAAGLQGGSIFGGISSGGAGGYIQSRDPNASFSARGGDGGNVSNNRITLTGTTSLTGDIYGGYSQGGSSGVTETYDPQTFDEVKTSNKPGMGGKASHNTVTLIGTTLGINGIVAGGWSINGDSTAPNLDPDYSNFYQANTLNLEGYRGAVQGLYHFEHYNWKLPADVVNRDVIIEIRGNELVDLNNTKHTVMMLSDGNRLKTNDEVVLISKAQGAPQMVSAEVQQGYFIIQDAVLGINDADEFVLTISDKSASRLNPVAKSFLEGRVAALAMVNQGADMIAEQLTECTTDVFAITDGGSSRYNTGSSVKITDQRLAIGGRKCFELPDTSQIMLGVFAEHGTGNYHSRNHFAGVDKVRGHGDLRYTGGGAMLHMDFAGTGSGINPAPVLASKDGVYVGAVLRAGNIKADFASNQIVDANNQRAEYTSKSHYASAMLGAGYAWNLDEHEQVELYARYTWDRLASDKVNVGGDELRFGTDHSSRLRVGTRYHYAVTPAIAPYAGVAYEHEFDGQVSGKVFDFSIDQPELKGSSGLLEVGVRTLPFGDDSGWHLDAGVQGYFGTRKGATGSLSVNYAF